MGWLLRTAAASAALGLALAPVGAANAVPGPGPNQWWFGSWAIQTDVWPLTKGKGVTVAVIDSGVNAALPDMSPVVLPGGDFTGAGGDGRTDSDSGGHGTGMASLIASQGTKSGFVGIAPEARILPVKAPSLNGRDTGLAVRFAVDNGAKVISVGRFTVGAEIHPHHCPPQLLQAIAYAAQQDVVVVAPAGNTGDHTNVPVYPASCPGVLAVGALGRDGKPWKATQRQDYVAVGAPGTGVGWLNKNGHVHSSGEGTNQAAALTAGAAALIRSRHPDMPAREVVQRLYNTAKDFGQPGPDHQLGNGVISIPRALDQDVPKTAPNPVYERLDKVIAAQKKSAKPEPSNTNAEDSDGLPLPLIGGIAAALVVVAAGVLALVFVLSRRKPSTLPAGPPPHIPQPPYRNG